MLSCGGPPPHWAGRRLFGPKTVPSNSGIEAPNGRLTPTNGLFKRLGFAFWLLAELVSVAAGRGSALASRSAPTPADLGRFCRTGLPRTLLTPPGVRGKPRLGSGFCKEFLQSVSVVQECAASAVSLQGEDGFGD